jgi:hypothetical protein
MEFPEKHYLNLEVDIYCVNKRCGRLHLLSITGQLPDGTRVRARGSGMNLMRSHRSEVPLSLCPNTLLCRLRWTTIPKKHYHSVRYWKIITVMNEETSTDKGLCSFCKPRIHDFSRLGWKKKHNLDGEVYLEPDITVLPDGDIDLVPFKDMEAFGSYGTDYPEKYGPAGRQRTVKGIEASGKYILIEFLKSFDLPIDASLKLAPPDDWEATTTDCSFCRTLIQALLGARKRRQPSKPWGRRVYIWSLKFRLEHRIVSDLMLDSGLLGAKLMLKSLVFEYQSRASIAQCELSVRISLKPSSTRW